MENEPNLPEIKRTSPSIDVNISSNRTVALTYNNTTVYSFHHPYSHLDHIIIEMGKGNPNIVLLDSVETVESLKEFRYPEVILPFPTNEDVEMYVDYQMSKFDKGAEELLGGE